VTQAARGISAVWLVILILLIVLGSAGAFAWLAHVRRERLLSNEASALATLAEISRAEADFRANDRDRNGVNDFWTADISGLFRYGLIRRALLTADANPLPTGSPPLPYNGYYFSALDMDDSETPPETYRQVTDPKSGAVHHPAKFGFVAFPAEQDVTGRYVYVINENHTIFRRSAAGGIPKNWPADRDLVKNWLSNW